jgi:hypothetical protein
MTDTEYYNSGGYYSLNATWEEGSMYQFKIPCIVQEKLIKAKEGKYIIFDVTERYIVLLKENRLYYEDIIFSVEIGSR